MTKSILIYLSIVVFSLGTACAFDDSKYHSYAVVVSNETSQDPAWSKVIEALTFKHNAKTIVYDGEVTESLAELKKQFPRYACFVARPSGAGLEFVANVHQLTRKLDDDPYTDVRWADHCRRFHFDSKSTRSRSKP